MKEVVIKNGLVNNRESTRLEFKKNFHKTQKEYIKTICAFANHNGGEIIFGVEDSPRKPTGISGCKYNDFNEYDPKELTTQIQNNLSENIEFSFSEFKQIINENEVVFGVLKIEESKNKPVICKTTDSGKKLREGAIYYRYNGKSEEIKSQDLVRLIQEEKEKERRAFLNHLEKITTKGASNVGVFSYDGEMFVGDKKVIIDKDAVNQIKFIKEGHFVEKDGAPALILKGEIKNIESLEVIEKTSDPNTTHPFEGLSTVKNEILKNNCISFIERETPKGTIKDGISIEGKKVYSVQFLLQTINQKLQLDNDLKYCWHNNKNTVKKYNQNFIDKCVEYLSSQENLQTLF